MTFVGCFSYVHSLYFEFFGELFSDPEILKMSYNMLWRAASSRHMPRVGHACQGIYTSFSM